VVVENRYVDADFRSDFSEFWAKRHDTVPQFCRRVHFFRARIDEADLDRLPANPGYLGYSVLRPGPHQDGHIGRTVLVPPQRFRSATLVTVTDKISFFGTVLHVTGSPYSEQDGEFLRCAHSAIWLCHYCAYRRGLVGRQLTAGLVGLTPNLLSELRALPSPGLTLPQIQAVFDATGQPALLYRLSGMPEVPGVATPTRTLDGKGAPKPPGYWDTRIFSVICRYLNSGFPVMIANANHAFVLVGWLSDKGKIRFVACDDQRGPYEVIASPFRDVRAPWQAIMVPLPSKVYLSGEMAETWGHQMLRAYGLSNEVPASWTTIASALGTTPKGISLRTFLRDTQTFKSALSEQRRHPDVVRALRLARLPHYVWVVEAHDRNARDADKPCVVAEVLFDPNSSDHRHRAPRTDAVSLPGLTVVNPPDEGQPVPVRYSEQPWRSQLSAP
jgi:hypothetical protein